MVTRQPGSHWVEMININADWRGLGLPVTLPLIYPRRPMAGAEEVTQLRELLTDDRGAMARVAIVLTLANAAQCRALDEAAKRELRSKYAVDLLFLAWDDVRAIARSADPGRLLRSMLLSKIDLTTVSVFKTSGPAERGMFFGRERELREIEEHAATTSYAVVGGRRIGKSSILLCLHLYRLAIKNFVTLYFDCATVADPENFERVILQGVAAAEPVWRAGHVPRAARRPGHERAARPAARRGGQARAPRSGLGLAGVQQLAGDHHQRPRPSRAGG